MNLLLVDEFPQMLPSLQRAMRELGIEISVTAVTTTAAARSELHRGASFDLILLDVAIHRDDGYALLAELSAAEPRTPVTVISAFDGTVDIVRALRLGASAFLAKDARCGALVETLRGAMSSAGSASQSK